MSTPATPGIEIVRLADRPQLADGFWALTNLWPTFMLQDPIADLYFSRAYRLPGKPARSRVRVSGRRRGGVSGESLEDQIESLRQVVPAAPEEGNTRRAAGPAAKLRRRARLFTKVRTGRGTPSLHKALPVAAVVPLARVHSSDSHRPDVASGTHQTEGRHERHGRRTDG